jgi:hypothetical protein
MDVTQKLIVGLLILSILFSFVSIAISYSASQLNLPNQPKRFAGNVVSGNGGGLNLYVEKSASSPGVGGG